MAVRVGVVFGDFPEGQFVLEPCGIEDCDACNEHIRLKEWEVEKDED